MVFCNSRKGQSGLEFLILIGFALMIMSVLIFLFSQNILDIERDRRDVIVDQFYNTLISEIELAHSARPYYERYFYLPSNLDGFEYSLEIRSDEEIVLEFKEDVYVRFLDSMEVEGQFEVGDNNTIVKNLDGSVELNP